MPRGQYARKTAAPDALALIAQARGIIEAEVMNLENEIGRVDTLKERLAERKAMLASLPTPVNGNGHASPAPAPTIATPVTLPKHGRKSDTIDREAITEAAFKFLEVAKAATVKDISQGIISVIPEAAKDARFSVRVLHAMNAAVKEGKAKKKGQTYRIG